MTSLYRALVDLEEDQQSGVLCTIISCHGSTPRGVGSKILVYPDGKIKGTVGGGELESRVIAEALESLKDGNSRILEYSMTDPERGDPGVCGGQLQIFVEPIMPVPLLVIVGGGHVGKEVAHLGRWLGFRVLVGDDRSDFCTPEAVPAAHEFFSGPLETLFEQIKITPWTYVVLTTRSVDVDIVILPDLLQSDAAYVGVIGSRRRWATTSQQLREAGIAQEEIDSIYSPVGLDISAETPKEIAISILSEIIQKSKGGKIQSFRESKK